MIITKELTSIGELIEFPFLEGLQDNLHPNRMSYTFRGQPNDKFELKSSIRRYSGDNYIYCESRLLNNFKKYGQLVEPMLCESVWHNMIIAQHYGIPTRCLDFSISPVVALYFALTNNFEEQNAVVWAINHSALHKKLLPKKYIDILDKYNAVSFTVEMLNEMNLSIMNYNDDMKNNSIVFLEPPSIDQRIINQFSHFAVIPDELDPLDEFLDNIDIDKTVYKFIIPHEKIVKFRKQLDYMNINERILFPGLDGTANYLKRRYQEKYLDS